MRVGIIGAGATGLAAAYDLGKLGHQVAVYERSPFLGGQASTFDVGGARLERGYHHLFTSDTDMVGLIHELGLGSKLRWIDSKVGIFHQGKIYNFVTPLDLLRFTPLSLPDRFRLGLVTLYLRRYKNWRKLESVTADAWIRKYAGRRVYDVVWGPLLRGKFGEDYYQQVAMPWFWGKIQTRFASRGKGMAKEKLGYPMGSFGEVFDVLGERIKGAGNEVYLSSAVRLVVVEDGRAVGLEVEMPGEEPRVRRFDAIIATTPSYVFPRLVPPLPQDYLNKLTKVNYLSAVLVILVLNRPLSHVYWLNIADRSIPFVGVIEQTNFVEPEHYGGKHIVYLSNYLSTQHPLYKKEHGELLEEYLPHLRKINPDFDRSWIETSYHHRVDAAQPIIGTNFSQRIPDHRTPFRGLYLANTTQIYPEDRGTNYSVRMGKQVAKMVMEDYT
ncbi:MAG: NAD(P)/FAD-dependent oxidoreductase [Chloroflexi bacterium]|nr:NAD(P)/FAD-dependent oxidoreductase [Chloroflexota bacterium]